MRSDNDIDVIVNQSGKSDLVTISIKKKKLIVSFLRLGSKKKFK